MSPTMLPSARRQQGLQGRHVLGIVLAFFGAILMVNGAMIYSAVSTHSGLVANEPYRKGLHYNDRIAAEERQARLGWSDKLEVDRGGRVALALADSDGRPISGLRLEAVLGRPSTNRQDVRLNFKEAAAGRYEAQTTPLAEGSWLVAVEARTEADGDEPVYRMRRRLWLRR